MGAAESKGQISPPETPVYLKYSHLKELQDPRSPMPCTGQRTPILTSEPKSFLDPRSPTTVAPRTPIFCIPEPAEDEAACVDSLEQIVESPKEASENGPSNEMEKETTEIHVESSPEKMANQVEFSDKGYLLKNKTTGGKKKRRRRKNKKVINNENQGLGTTKEKTFHLEDPVPRSPLVSRNFKKRAEPESPSLEYLLKNTRRMSLNSKTNAFNFENVESMGKENMAATFSP